MQWNARRSRRLTDLTETVGAAGLVKSSATISAGVGAGSLGTVDSASAALQSNASCYGGGLEQNKVVQVGSFKITYSVHTQAGTDPGGNVKDNQDSWAIMERIGGQDMLMLGVFDGHGAEGRAVSSCIAQKLPRILEQSALLKPTTLDAAMTAAFPEANRAMRRTPTIDCDLSGSTGVVALVVGASGKLVVGNVGDSRCVLGRVDVRGSSVTAVPLTRDHTPAEQAEADRVMACGGRIATFMHGDEPLGPPRVWLRDINVPGLCMTRSFGDGVAATVGVIDRPEVMSAVLKPGLDRYIVVMSDGIFEFMDSQMVMEAVHQAASRGETPNEVAKRLVKEARRRWQVEEDGIIDDCTILVAYLADAGPAKPFPRSSAGAGLAHAGSGMSSMLGPAGAAGSLASHLEGSLRLGGGSTGGAHSAHTAAGMGGLHGHSADGAAASPRSRASSSNGGIGGGAIGGPGAVGGSMLRVSGNGSSGGGSLSGSPGTAGHKLSRRTTGGGPSPVASPTGAAVLRNAGSGNILSSGGSSRSSSGGGASGGMAGSPPARPGVAGDLRRVSNGAPTLGVRGRLSNY